MQKNIRDDIIQASECIKRVQREIARLDKSNEQIRLVVDSLSPFVNVCANRLERATSTVSELHAHFLLAPETFNPFNLWDVERTYSQHNIETPIRTIVGLKTAYDPDPKEKQASAEERLQHKVRMSFTHPGYKLTVTTFL